MNKEEIIQDLKQENIKLKEELELVKKKLRISEQDVFRLAVEKNELLNQNNSFGKIVHELLNQNNDD